MDNKGSGKGEVFQNREIRVILKTGGKKSGEKKRQKGCERIGENWGSHLLWMVEEKSSLFRRRGAKSQRLEGG